jgi:SAM-dependent methyltransferase
MRLCPKCATRITESGWSCARCGFALTSADGVPILAPELAWGNPYDASYGYDEVFAVERGHFWFVNRSALIAWAIRRYFPHAQSVLDVGCGTGGVLAALRSALPPTVRFSAGDALVTGLEFARRQLPDVSFAQVDIRRLPYDREFDVVGVFDVLEHLDDDEQALREIYRSTTVGGGLVVTVPQHPSLWSALDVYSHHRRRYRRRELLGAIERAGFAIVRATSFMTLTLPAQFIARSRKQDLATLDPATEMRINPAINGFFGALCRFERMAITMGASFPMGGSLLAVARRAT